MGRPLNKRYFGDPANDGPQIVVKANFTGTSENAFIVKQLSTYRFRVKDVATQTKVMDAMLVSNDPSSINIGEMTIEFTSPSSTFYARSVQSKRMKGKEAGGTALVDLPWHFDVPTADRLRINNS